jgi:hypothetical protein
MFPDKIKGITNLETLQYFRQTRLETFERASCEGGKNIKGRSNKVNPRLLQDIQ